jgi:hypothetical protein
MNLKGIHLAGLELLKSDMIYEQIPMAVTQTPDEIREVPVDFVILHVGQGFVQLVRIPRFKNPISFVAGRTHVKKIEQQMSILPEAELPMIRHLHRLIDKQVPRVSTVPMRCSEESRVGDEQQITSLIAVFELRRDAGGDLVAGTASGDYRPGPSLYFWKPVVRVLVGLLAQRDGWLDERTLHVTRDTLTGECGRGIGLTGPCWAGARPKMWH